MVLISLFPALTLLYLHVSTFRSTCSVPNMAVFCSSLTSWFPGMLITYFLNDFEMVPVAPIITGITFVYCYYHYYTLNTHELPQEILATPKPNTNFHKNLSLVSQFLSWARKDWKDKADSRFSHFVNASQKAGKDWKWRNGSLYYALNLKGREDKELWIN